MQKTQKNKKTQKTQKKTNSLTRVARNLQQQAAIGFESRQRGAW